jgi:hypothetical protein
MTDDAYQAEGSPEPLKIRPLTVEGKARVEALLARALEDIEFRELLLDDPDQAMRETDLTPDEKKMVYSMHRVALEEWGVDVRRYRAFLRDNGFKIAPSLPSEREGAQD